MASSRTEPSFVLPARRMFPFWSWIASWWMPLWRYSVKILPVKSISRRDSL